MFRETLPPQCPPATANAADGLEVYRVIRDNTPTSADFDSQVKCGTIDASIYDAARQCQAHACSVFAKYEKASGLVKLPKFKGTYKAVAKLVLTPAAGPVLLTGGCHYAWWITASYDPVAHVVEVRNVA